MTEERHDFKIDADEMRRMGYRVVDAIVDRFENVESERAVRVGDAKALAASLSEPMPEAGVPFDDILERVLRDVTPYSVTLAHPRFFAFISSPGNYVSSMADALVAGLNPFVGTWLGGSGPSALELVTVDWLREMCGFPEGAGGLFTSGGSSANLTALAAARHVRSTGAADTVYFNEQLHYSNERALRTLGFDPEQFRRVPSNKKFQMDVVALERIMDDDRAAGRKPMCVIATSGTTNTGAVDPLEEIAGLCRRHDAWLHVDGAYGAAAALSPKLRPQVAGIALADSLALDPHKWLFQPFEIGCVLVRDMKHLRETFQVMPDYLKDVHELGEVNFADHGIQLTRSFRALKLWMSLQYYGAKRFRAAIDYGVALAEYAERSLRKRSGWEVVTPASLAITSFRRVPAGMGVAAVDHLNHAMVKRVMADGFALISSTTLHGRTALRLCTINPSTTTRHIDETLDYLESISE